MLLDAREVLEYDSTRSRVAECSDLPRGASNVIVSTVRGAAAQDVNDSDLPHGAVQGGGESQRASESLNLPGGLANEVESIRDLPRGAAQIVECRVVL